MIALDASAILAIISDEREADRFARIIAENDCVVGAPTRLEAAIVIRGRSLPEQLRQMDILLNSKNVVTTAFGPEHLAAAEAAFELYGKGQGHKARLNFGDCMAYAIAKIAVAPLLFKGDDFTHTDIVPAYSA